MHNSILIRHVNKNHVGNFYNIVHDKNVIPRLYDSLETDPRASILHCTYVSEYISKVRLSHGKHVAINEIMFVAGVIDNPNDERTKLIKVLIRSEIYYMYLVAFINCINNGWIKLLK